LQPVRAECNTEPAGEQVLPTGICKIFCRPGSTEITLTARGFLEQGTNPQPDNGSFSTRY
jgi:hypothetical protein